MGPNEAKQMEMLLEEGGIADDGTTVDPVSGNEVPPGSMAKEVRDDVPAQLSEGEYIVPADVVRFFGVKFFEDLRSEAKGGLSAMEANGRIGGEPVSQTMDNQAEGELTAEELSVLQELGMAVGGMVPQATNNMYQQPSPVAMGNTGSYNRGDQVLYAAEGTDVSTSNVDPYTAQFTSDMGSSFAPGYLLDDILGPQEEPTEVVTLYGPNGEVEAVILPSQKDRYDELIKADYSTDPVELTTETDVGREEPDGGYGGFEPSSEDTQEAASVSSMTNDQLSANAKAIGVISNLGKVVLGPVASTALGSVTTARYNDILDEMNYRGLDTTGMDRKGSIFGGEESLLGGLDDTNDDGKVDFGDTFLGDLLGLDGKAGVQGKSLKDSWKGGRRSGAPMDATGGANTSEGAQVGDTFGAEDLGGYTDNSGNEGGSDFGGGDGDDFGGGMGIGGLYSKGGIVKRRSKKNKKK